MQNNDSNDINYSLLKTKIKSIERDIQLKDEVSKLSNLSIVQSDRIEENASKEISCYLNNFLSQLNEEIKKVYIFVTSSERELYININSHLHKRKTFRYIHFVT